MHVYRLKHRDPATAVCNDAYEMFGGDEILNTTQTTPWFDRQYLNDNKDLVSLAQHYTHKLYTLTCAACINTQWMPKLPMYAFLQVDFYGQQRFKATVAGGAHQSNGILLWLS